MINSEQYLDNDQATPVAVAVRVKKTTDHQQKSVILSPKKSEITLVGPNLPQEKFRFDHVLGEHVTQEDLFATVVSPFLPLIFDGFDFFVITYGGRSSGKSFTLFGPDHGPLRSEADFGILPRFVRHIFKNSNATEMAVKVSSFDVSNDDISDLLSRGQRRKSLIGNQDVAIEPATEIECHDVQEVLQCYDSSANVSKAKNVQNSVISHHFFKVILEQRIGNLGIKSTVTFVDLAPSNSVRVEAGYVFVNLPQKQQQQTLSSFPFFCIECWMFMSGGEQAALLSLADLSILAMAATAVLVMMRNEGFLSVVLKKYSFQLQRNSYQ